MYKQQYQKHVMLPGAFVIFKSVTHWASENAHKTDEYH